MHHNFNVISFIFGMLETNVFIYQNVPSNLGHNMGPFILLFLFHI